MVSSSRGISADDAAAAEDQGAVADALDLLEVRRDEQHRQPLAAASAAAGDRSPPWSRRRRRWSAPRGRAARTFASIQRATTTFCWLPPESVATARSGSCGLDREALEHRAGCRRARLRGQTSSQHAFPGRRPGSCRCSRAPPCWRRGSPRRAGSRRSRCRLRHGVGRIGRIDRLAVERGHGRPSSGIWPKIARPIV